MSKEEWMKEQVCEGKWGRFVFLLPVSVSSHIFQDGPSQRCKREWITVNRTSQSTQEYLRPRFVPSLPSSSKVSFLVFTTLYFSHRDYPT